MNLNYVHVGDWCSAEPVWRWTTTGGSNPTAAEVLPETVDWRVERERARQARRRGRLLALEVAEALKAGGV